MDARKAERQPPADILESYELGNVTGRGAVCRLREESAVAGSG